MDPKNLKKIIQNEFLPDSSGHDIYHLERVCGLALKIQEKEGGDREVIAYASFLHDVHRIMGGKIKKFCSPKDSLPKIKIILEKVKAPKEKIEKILHCIEFHEEYGFSKKGKTAQDIETLILQDADNLDAIGAIGIARAFMFGGAYNIPMYLPTCPFRKKYFNEAKFDISEIHHFYSKLLRLKNDLHTKTGKKLAKKRHAFMKKYLEEFFKEWNEKDN